MWLDRTCDSSWIQHFRALRGPFRRSGYERGLLWFFATLLLSLWSFELFSLWRRGAGDRLYEGMVFLVLSGVVILPLSFYLLRRAGYGYYFEAGQIQLQSGAGKVLWAESLSGILSIRRRSKRWPRFFGQGYKWNSGRAI